MNKLLESLRTDMTNRVRIMERPVQLSAAVSEPEPVNNQFSDRANEYKVSVGLEYRFVCFPEAVTAMEKNVFKQIREDLYGDMINQILRLERLIYDQDCRASPELQAAIRDLWVIVRGN